jgi:RNA polymerase sigma-70 factor, ECF subfamily
VTDSNGTIDDEDTQASNARLWRRVRRGDAAAFGLLFERHADAIYNYCFRRTGDWTAAEDLLSLVFLEAWRHRSQQLDGPHVLPWLYGIATNVIRNHHRGSRRYRRALALLSEQTPEPVAGDTALSHLEDELAMGAALALLDELPPHERDVFALVAWADLSYEEAAAALGVPVGTVRSRVARARARLRKLVTPDPGPRSVHAQEVTER